MRSSVRGIVRNNPALAAAIAVQLCLVAIRSIHLYYTGFMTSDEANYVFRSIEGLPYGYRLFFDYSLIVLFRLFGISSLPAFLEFFPVYVAFWSVLFLLAAYGILQMLEASVFVRNFTLLTVFFMVSYSLLSVGFLSEMPGLTTATLGIYLLLRFLRRVRKGWLLVGSALAFTASTYTREPYVIFPVGLSLALAAGAVTRRVRLVDLLSFVIPCLLIFALPNGPVYAGVPVAGAALTTASIPLCGEPSLYTLPCIFRFSSVLSVIGLVLGWGPILFCVGALGVFYSLRGLLKRKGDAYASWIAFLSIFTFLTVTFLYYAAYYFYLGQGLSNLIRFTNTTVPAYLLLAPVVFRKLSVKRLKVVAIALITLTAVASGAYGNLTQTNLGLSYDVYGFSHQFSTLHARNYILARGSNETYVVLFVPFDWKAAYVYLISLPGVSIYPAVETEKLFLTGFYSVTRGSPVPADAQLAQLRPSAVYILVGLPLVKNETEFLGNLGYGTFPSVVVDTYRIAAGSQLSSSNLLFNIRSVHVVFSDASGSLLKAVLDWS